MADHGFDLSIEIFYCHCGNSYKRWDELDAHISEGPTTDLGYDDGWVGKPASQTAEAYVSGYLRGQRNRRLHDQGPPLAW